MATNCSGPCFGCAGNVILKGMAGDGKRIIVGFFYHQIEVEVDDVRPGGTGGGGGMIPVGPPPVHDRPDYERPNPDNVEVTITVRWPFMDKPKILNFIMKRSWANIVVNRIGRINTFNENFMVKYNDIKDGFVVKYDQLREKFKVKWKK
jgi:hypothetical protein